jgi:hypothetical protein
MITLYKNNRRFDKLIHRLILETFIGPCPEGMECCHKNDVPTDNRLENLRWDTRSNNVKDAFRNGGRCEKGEYNNRAKLNILQIRVIRRLLEFNTLTQKEIGNIFSVGQPCIFKIKHKRRWAHV